MSWRMYMKMKLPILIIIGLFVAVAFIIPVVSAGNSATGNGAMSGKHFTLNLIGAKEKTSMPEGLGGHTIFVLLNRDGSKVTTKINLYEGDFAVLDKDGTDRVAAFQLPYPYETFGDITSDACYAVYARALGKPGGSADMYACEWDKTLSEEVCYSDTQTIITIKRPSTKGPSKFQDITKQLTMTNATTPIFGEANHDYYWNYDNFGLKHAQLRFYQLGTCDDSPYGPTW